MKENSLDCYHGGTEAIFTERGVLIGTLGIVALEEFAKFGFEDASSHAMDEDNLETMVMDVLLHDGADVIHLHLKHILIVQTSGVWEELAYVEIDLEEALLFA